MTVNVELAKTVLNLIRKYPERHDQELWATRTDLSPLKDCGTSACIAGWVAAANGLTVKQVPGGSENIDKWAAVQLGIDESTADDLFYCFDNEEALTRLDNLIQENS
jgi:hypothetical protein